MIFVSMYLYNIHGEYLIIVKHLEQFHKVKKTNYRIAFSSLWFKKKHSLRNRTVNTYSLKWLEMPNFIDNNLGLMPR